jgi:hypothetical protein
LRSWYILIPIRALLQLVLEIISFESSKWGFRHNLLLSIFKPLQRIYLNKRLVHWVLRSLFLRCRGFRSLSMGGRGECVCMKFKAAEHPVYRVSWRVNQCKFLSQYEIGSHASFLVLQLSINWIVVKHPRRKKKEHARKVLVSHIKRFHTVRA